MYDCPPTRCFSMFYRTGSEKTVVINEQPLSHDVE